MARTSWDHHRPRSPRSAILALALLSLAACAGDHAPRDATLTAADFLAPDARTAADPAPRPREPGFKSEVMTLADARPDVAVLVGPPPAPDVTALPASTTGSAMVMDSLIGDVNGAPLYASAFFEPIDARLAGVAARQRSNKQAWTAEAKKIVGDQLTVMIRDQLLLAEARASLTPEQKKGLLAFVDQVRRDLVSHGGGGRAAVDESLREQGEKGLDAKLKENIDRQLIYAKLREKILPLATISWHDVQVEYEHRAEKFNPDPKAVFHMIWVPADNADLVAKVSADLAAGTPFIDVATRPENEFKPETAGLVEQPFKGDYAKAELFGPAELNTPARNLSPGAIAGPITFGKWTAWILLDHIDTPQARSIYEAQLAIYNELRNKKIDEESQKYITRLLDRESYSKFTDMADKLLAIATERYFEAAQ